LGGIHAGLRDDEGGVAGGQGCAVRGGRAKATAKEEADSSGNDNQKDNGKGKGKGDGDGKDVL